MFAGLSATIAALKIAGVAVVIAVLGFFIWNYQHRGNVIADLQREVASLNSKAEVLYFNQDATAAILDKFSKSKVVASNAKATIHQMYQEPDPTNYINFTRRFRVRPENTTGPPGNGATAGHP